MYFCICSDKGKNIVGQIDPGKEKELTSRKILDQYCPGINALWIKTEKYAYALKPDDHPFLEQPKLILTSKPGLWDYPSTTLFTFNNFDPNSKLLFFAPKHSANEKIPRVTTVVPMPEFQSNLTNLFSIIENSFLGPVKVNSLLVNDKELDNNTKISELFEIAKKEDNEISVSFDVSEKCLSKINFRENVTNEILYSENSYVNDLTVIVEVWQKVFENQSSMDEFDFKTIFKDFPMILNYHKQFIELLKQKTKGYASEFARLFLQFTPFFKVSTNYITHYPSVNQFLNERENDSDFQNIINQISQTLKGRDLASFLITPVQRLPRYSLFLREIEKGTPISHPDYIFLKAARSSMEDLNKEIDEKTAFIESQRILSVIQFRNYSDFEYMAPNRRVIKQFDTIIQSRFLKGKFIVCNDYIFLIDNSDFFCRFKCPTKEVPIEKLEDDLSIKIVSPDYKIDYDDENIVSFLKKEDRDEFMNLIVNQ